MTYLAFMLEIGTPDLLKLMDRTVPLLARASQSTGNFRGDLVLVSREGERIAVEIACCKDNQLKKIERLRRSWTMWKAGTWRLKCSQDRARSLASW